MKNNYKYLSSITLEDFNDFNTKQAGAWAECANSYIIQKYKDMNFGLEDYEKYYFKSIRYDFALLINSLRRKNTYGIKVTEKEWEGYKYILDYVKEDKDKELSYDKMKDIVNESLYYTSTLSRIFPTDPRKNEIVKAIAYIVNKLDEDKRDYYVLSWITMKGNFLFGFNVASETIAINDLIFKYEEGKNLLKPIMKLDTENYDPEAEPEDPFSGDYSHFDKYINIINNFKTLEEAKSMIGEELNKI